MDHIFRVFPHFAKFCDGIYFWIKDSVFLFPMFLSMLSAWIFWFVFSDLPEKRKRAGMLPLIQLDLINLRSELFRLFDTALAFEPHLTSESQGSIMAGTITVDDFRFGLQNKCLNDNYKFDECHELLTSFGPEIFSRAKNIERLIDKVVGQFPYTSMEEVHLLEKIRASLRVYYHENMLQDDPATKIGKGQWRPVNPTLSYRAKNFHELYGLFMELQGIILSAEKYYTPMLYSMKMNYLFRSGQYRACVEFIHAKWDEMEESFNRSFTLASCHYYLGERFIFLTYMNQLLGSELNIHEPVSNRSSFKQFLEDEDFMRLLLGRYTNSQLQALRITLRQDEERHRVLSSRNRYLEEHYLKKLLDNTLKQ